MKITDSKGNKRDISSFFHSKSKEILFKKIYFFCILILLICISLISIIIFSLVPLYIVSLVIILILSVLSVLFVQEHLSKIVFYIMKQKEDREINYKINSNRKYKNMNSSKKNNFIFKNTPFNSKRRFLDLFKFSNTPSFSHNSHKSKQKGVNEKEEYIEIR